jgi:hypothetical protein
MKSFAVSWKGRPGSFKVNLRSGRWADFANDQKGGDAISLAAHLYGLSRPLVSSNRRRSNAPRAGQDFALEAKFVSRTNRTRPAEFIESRGDDAARRLELASDQEPHCHGCGVPAASRHRGTSSPARPSGRDGRA